MDIRDEAEREIQNTYWNDHYEKKHIVKEMMGDTYVTFFEDEDTDHPDPEKEAERIEALRDSMRENDLIAQYEVEQERNIDHALDNKL